jgi:hypothetical protein
MEEQADLWSTYFRKSQLRERCLGLLAPVAVNEASRLEPSEWQTCEWMVRCFPPLLVDIRPLEVRVIGRPCGSHRCYRGNSRWAMIRRRMRVAMPTSSLEIWLRGLIDSVIVVLHERRRRRLKCTRNKRLEVVAELWKCIVTHALIQFGIKLFQHLRRWR